MGYWGYFFQTPETSTPIFWATSSKAALRFTKPQ
jgi:hypothetical protein